MGEDIVLCIDLAAVDLRGRAWDEVVDGKCS